jgi:hypothetical protein
MPWVEFEPTILAYERAKTVHTLDPSATVKYAYKIIIKHIGYVDK